RNPLNQYCLGDLTMKSRILLLAAAVFLSSGFAFRTHAQEAQPGDVEAGGAEPGTPEPAPDRGPAERIGERLDRGIERLGSRLREGGAEAKRSVERMGIAGRVYGRIHWDKHLASAEFDIDAKDEGVIILRGT